VGILFSALVPAFAAANNVSQRYGLRIKKGLD
jgi:hypothetical protein